MRQRRAEGARDAADFGMKRNPGLNRLLIAITWAAICGSRSAGDQTAGASFPCTT